MALFCLALCPQSILACQKGGIRPIAHGHGSLWHLSSELVETAHHIVSVIVIFVAILTTLAVVTDAVPVCVCMCMCACVFIRKRERERESARDRTKECESNRRRDRERRERKGKRERKRERERER